MPSYKSFCCSPGLNRFRMVFQRPLMTPFSSWQDKEFMDGVNKGDKSSLCPKPNIFTVHVGWLCEPDAESSRDATPQSYNPNFCAFKAVSD